MLSRLFLGNNTGRVWSVEQLDSDDSYPAGTTMADINDVSSPCGDGRDQGGK